MTISKLSTYHRMSRHNGGQRANSVTRITPHCVVGQWGAQQIADYFATCDVEASCNYGIGKNGAISCSTPEEYRSFCSSNRDNDNRAITIEIASTTTDPYTMTNESYQALINLCVDICQRYGKTKLIWINNKDKALSYTLKSNEMLLTVHQWFANKACPGRWLMERMEDMCNHVNAKLGNVPNSPTTTSSKWYKVQVGAFKDKNNAFALVDKIKKAGYDSFVTPVDNLFKVQVGAFKDKNNALALVEKLKKAGFDCFIV